MALFERNPLDADTGLQKERWQQEGNVLVNELEGVDGAEVVISAISGKIFYMTQCILSGITAIDNIVQIRNNPSSPSTKFYWFIHGTQQDDMFNINFNPPVAFTHDIQAYTDEYTKIQIIGWFENA